MSQLTSSSPTLPALHTTNQGHPGRSASKVRLEPIDAAGAGSHIDASGGRIRPKRSQSLPRTAFTASLAIERMRRFSKESIAVEEQQGRGASKQGPGGVRTGSKEAGQLRRAGILRVTGRRGSQQENLVPGALGKGQEDDRLASVIEHTHPAAQVAAEAAAAAEAVRETREKQELARFTRELGMPVDIVKDAAELFRSHLDDCGTDSLGDATLPLMTVCDLFGQKAEGHEGRRVDFKSFAMAFFCRGFSEGCVLTPEQRQLRQLARKHDMDFANMDLYKRCFDEFDTDGNKTIDAGEFKELLYRLNKMPEGYSLPDSRVSQLWAEADIDKSGVLDFEEFVIFYRKYYEREGEKKDPFTRFYCTARHKHV